MSGNMRLDDGPSTFFGKLGNWESYLMWESLYLDGYFSRHPQYIQHKHTYSKLVSNQFSCSLGSVCCQGRAVAEKLLPWPGIKLWDTP